MDPIEHDSADLRGLAFLERKAHGVLPRSADGIVLKHEEVSYLRGIGKLIRKSVSATDRRTNPGRIKPASAASHRSRRSASSSFKPQQSGGGGGETVARSDRRHERPKQATGGIAAVAFPQPNAPTREVCPRTMRLSS
jgi:hypothetical protein